VRWDEHSERTENIRNLHKILVLNPEETVWEFICIDEIEILKYEIKVSP
jgi:hypothetical protein